MFEDGKILAVTKRTADLCATQSVVHRAGLALVTATTMQAADSVIKAAHVKGVIVCRHSWSDAERESIVEALARQYPELMVVVQCSGCTACEEAAGRPGMLCETARLSQLLAVATGRV